MREWGLRKWVRGGGEVGARLRGECGIHIKDAKADED